MQQTGRCCGESPGWTQESGESPAPLSGPGNHSWPVRYLCWTQIIEEPTLSKYLLCAWFWTKASNGWFFWSLKHPYGEVSLLCIHIAISQRPQEETSLNGKAEIHT